MGKLNQVYVLFALVSRFLRYTGLNSSTHRLDLASSVGFQARQGAVVLDRPPFEPPAAAPLPEVPGARRLRSTVYCIYLCIMYYVLLFLFI